MATETILKDRTHVLAVNRKESADLIGLLTAQLAGVPLCNNASGAAPSINVVEHGAIKYRLVLCLDNSDEPSIDVLDLINDLRYYK